MPIDCFTTGNHVWDKREGYDLLDRDPRLLRPANYPAGNPGKGLYVGETAAGIPVATINLELRVFMKNGCWKSADSCQVGRLRDSKLRLSRLHMQQECFLIDRFRSQHVNVPVLEG